MSSDASVSNRVRDAVSASCSGTVAIATSTSAPSRNHSRERSELGTIWLKTTPAANGTARPDSASRIDQPT